MICIYMINALLHTETSGGKANWTLKQNTRWDLVGAFYNSVAFTNMLNKIKHVL
jgi:hypothetical protein